MDFSSRTAVYKFLAKTAATSSILCGRREAFVDEQSGLRGDEQVERIFSLRELTTGFKGESVNDNAI